MSESNPPVEGTVINSAKPLGNDGIQPMSKVEAGVIVTVFVGICTAVGFAIKADIKNEKERQEKWRADDEARNAKAEATRRARAKWFDDQRKSKKVVLELRDGAYIAISSEAYADAEVKKKGEWLS